MHNFREQVFQSRTGCEGWVNMGLVAPLKTA
jgi:hypothetical protein